MLGGPRLDVDARAVEGLDAQDVRRARRRLAVRPEREPRVRVFPEPRAGRVDPGAAIARLAGRAVGVAALVAAADGVLALDLRLQRAGAVAGADAVALGLGDGAGAVGDGAGAGAGGGQARRLQVVGAAAVGTSGDSSASTV